MTREYFHVAGGSSSPRFLDRTLATIILTGDKALDRNLAQLTGAAGRKVFNKAARAAAKPVAKQARANAPSRTGRLKKSIKVRSIARSRNKIGIRVTTGNETGDFGGDGYYGAFLEYGYKRGKRSAGVKAAQSLKRRGRLNQTSQWFLRRRVKAEIRALKARAGDKRAEVKGQHYMKRAADSGRAQAASTFQAVAKTELAAAVAAMPKK